jgi:hypothetical protein
MEGDRPVRVKKGKIKATPITYNNIHFKSLLEYYCYSKLLEEKIKVRYEGRTFKILPSFKYRNEKVRKMTYTPDFVGDTFIIEVKSGRAVQNESFPLRWKIFKYYLYNKKLNYELYLVRSKKDIHKVVKEIKDKLDVKQQRGIKKQIQRYKEFVLTLV